MERELTPLLPFLQETNMKAKILTFSSWGDTTVLDLFSASRYS